MQDYCMKSSLKFFLSLLFLVLPVYSEISPPFSVDELKTHVENSLKTYHVPGLALGIVVDGKIMLTNGYGCRDLVRHLPVTAKTLFPIASCTKAFTAALFAQLVDAGKIS